MHIIPFSHFCLLAMNNIIINLTNIKIVTLLHKGINVLFLYFSYLFIRIITATFDNLIF